jgi:hypothetical protein
MPSAVIDACCLIDLFASGHAEAILRAAALDWHVPVAVQSEVQFIRQHDPQQPGQTIAVAADFAPLISSAALCVCKPEDSQELTRFTQYAAVFRSDGEAMCLAIAESRGWIVATVARKAIRTGQAAGLTVVSCPELLKKWSDAARPAKLVLHQALKDIRFLAQFVPNSSMPCHKWWNDQLAKAGP